MASRRKVLLRNYGKGVVPLMVYACNHLSQPSPANLRFVNREFVASSDLYLPRETHLEFENIYLQQLRCLQWILHPRRSRFSGAELVTQLVDSLMRALPVRLHLQPPCCELEQKAQGDIPMAALKVSKHRFDPTSAMVFGFALITTPGSATCRLKRHSLSYQYGP
jgi:hypothetical protein